MLKKLPKASTCSGSRELPRVQDLSQDLVMTCDMWARVQRHSRRFRVQMPCGTMASTACCCVLCS